MFKSIHLLGIILFFSLSKLSSQQHSIAREWNEIMLFSIKNDLARPTVHARNLFHVSAAMYDAWALFDSTASTYFIGKTVGGYPIPYTKTSYLTTNDSAKHQAISYASYRILKERFKNSNKVAIIYQAYDEKMNAFGYDINYTNTDYTTGDARALGNYIAEKIIAYGKQDFSNEDNGYKNTYYKTINEPIVPKNSGNNTINDINRWQPIALDVIIDQAGNILGSGAAPFLSAEWGKVVPFSLNPNELAILQRDSTQWWMYHNPGPPPLMQTSKQILGLDDFFKWNFAMVSIWSSHHTPEDSTIWDISPNSIGNIKTYPVHYDDYKSFYKFLDGNDSGLGYEINPRTGQPYTPQYVKRGDYTRVLSEFWADGPNSTTPPGHWFEIINYVMDHPHFNRKFNGKGDEMDALEYDAKSYLLLGGTLHDVAISTWGIKGYYDYCRPVSSIRAMAELGQSSDSLELNYHPGGLPLVPGYIEIIKPWDPLRGVDGKNIGEIKIKAWKGPNYLVDVKTDIAYVDWILAKDWWPYQRATFVTPPFAGYISGHSTYSSAAAEILTYLTGDEYFPGGMAEFNTVKNEYLIHEDGPSTDLTLQWARYKDASDQCSLSRIWGGIHPPIDDIPGRKLGNEIAKEAIAFSNQYFYIDKDHDGFTSIDDCKDDDALIHPNATEICNEIDDNCDGEIDNGIILFSYYVDNDGDGFGDANVRLDTCSSSAPLGFVNNANDCDENNQSINPEAVEVCNGLDDNCDGIQDEGLVIYSYYNDADNDGFGNAFDRLDTCSTTLPTGYSMHGNDCNDHNDKIHPLATESCDKIDNNCNEIIDEGLPVYIYFVDEDKDGFGLKADSIIACDVVAPSGYVNNGVDCNDQNANIHPQAIEVADNGIDEDCDGLDLITNSVNDFNDSVKIIEEIFKNGHVEGMIWNMQGQKITVEVFRSKTDLMQMIKNLPIAYYILEITDLTKQNKKARIKFLAKG